MRIKRFPRIDRLTPFSNAGRRTIIITPRSPRSVPSETFFVGLYLRNSVAATRRKTGALEVIIGAVILDVNCSPKKRKEIVKVIPKKERDNSCGISRR